MTEKQKQGAKQAARDFYRAGRISLKTAAWAMKNAGYTREETAEWLELAEKPKKRRLINAGKEIEKNSEQHKIHPVEL
jgi:hypothetical protein